MANQLWPIQVPGLYVITDTDIRSAGTLFKTVEQSLQAGAAVIQYRDKHSQPRTRYQVAKQLRILCHAYQRPLIINDDVDLAVQVEADGVHLGQRDASLSEAREALGEDRIIGATCHGDIELAEQAVAAGADYVAFGAFYPSQTKPGAKLIPPQLLTKAKEKLSVPIVAIGGVTADRIQPLRERGADLVAISKGISQAFDPLETAKECVSNCSPDF